MNRDEADEGGAVFLRVFIVQLESGLCLIISDLFYVCVCSHSAPCGLPVRPCEHSEAAVGEESDGRLSGCDETHAAVSSMRDGSQRCHTDTHQRWV